IGLSHDPGSAGAPVVGAPVVGAPVVGAPLVGAPLVPVPLVPVDASLAPGPASAPPQPNAVTAADKTSALRMFAPYHTPGPQCTARPALNRALVLSPVFCLRWPQGLRTALPSPAMSIILS